MNYTFDHPLFLWLNVDGPAPIDELMLLVSTPAVWSWLYLLILYMVWRDSGWRGVVLMLVTAAAAILLSDMIAGIFKHTGVLKHLWAEFPARLRPMYTPELEGMVSNVLKKGGQYGTVSAHAATMMSMAVIAIPTIGRRWFTWMMCGVVVLVCYSRIYLGYHFPMDIALGLMIGFLSGGVAYLAMRAVGQRWK